MPDLEMGLGDFGGVTQNRRCNEFDKRFRKEWCQADHNHKYDEDRWRHPEAQAGIMRFRRVVVPDRPKESVTNQPKAICGGEE